MLHPMGVSKWMPKDKAPATELPLAGYMKYDPLAV